MAFTVDFSSPEFTNSLGKIGLYAQLAGVGNNFIGNYYQSRALKNQLSHQSRMDEINARMANLQRESALEQGNRQVGQLTMKAGKLKSSQRVAMAANGLVLGQGSSRDILASTDLMKELDSNTILQNAMQTAFASEATMVNYQNRASMYQAASKAISPAGSAFASLLGGVGQVASSWYNLRAARGIY